jgi:uncharacterized protein (DUF433 family)
MESMMSQTVTGYGHVVLNDAGVPILAGTTMKVIELVSEYLAYGWSPEELQLNHSYLTLGQVYSALAYYWDNREVLEQDMDRRQTYVDRIREKIAEPEIIRHLRARKQL